MPKREKTPSPSPDEPKYFTVVHPWPGHLDLSLPGDGKQMCMWLAAACGTSDPIMSFFYRPGSPGLCIIELEKSWAEQHARRLLGCHSWNEFLCEKPKTTGGATSVFFSHYTSHREVQKMGWKTVDLDDSWFGTPVERTKKFVRPYPSSTWCPQPAHDTTGHSFCRPLPVSLFPEGNLGNAVTAPVGSQAWTKKRTIAPGPLLLKGSARPTSEPLISPDYEDNWGPAGHIIEPIETTETIEGTEDLSDKSGEAETELISDLPVASFGRHVDYKGVCPHHGTKCKKGLCGWRAEYEKQKEKEVGYPEGPSNIKNHYRKSNSRRAGRGRSNSGNRGNHSETPSPRTHGQPSPVTPNGPWRPSPVTPNSYERPSPVTANNSRAHQPATSAPSRGNGSGRGQPAWAPLRGGRPA